MSEFFFLPCSKRSGGGHKPHLLLQWEGLCSPSPCLEVWEERSNNNGNRNNEKLL